MRWITAGLAVALAAALSAQAPAGAQVAATPFEANRIVCAAEGAKLIGDLREEIAAQNRSDPSARPWTPAQERERLDADLKEVLANPGVRREFTANFASLWEDAGNNGGDPDFLGRPMLLVAACAITLADGWDAGVRDVAQLTRRWAEARHATYKLPGAPAPVPTEDPAASDPVDCVRLDEREGGSYGAFRNTCDFDVYFTYCGINPEEGSMIADCHKQSFGLIDVAARGVQGGFTRGADKIYLFECRSPKTPKEVEFAGNGLRGFCR